ncbi:PREDICTED: iduronate 2-sulfatase [Dinoponera quadriceps]|uniref:Iduronate 2-sulfatase n=1 Tax=Dinoponera quadriceps TaxID=609295 RepID=A0A6P3Y0K8_DINQU|nr:PREDICTED: iduronate 2-sulfatase [Dinoponera quadriceps]XP_014484328.1 PREDICTED: iduronate 2-sulfatase [Dinoponera quadriceps]XP_014484329.1 PREDICTED: iduronate 2-sulfatase [Dinoponera quadriceps]XP_014484330.1 PREDICTED: iduronate 2-sulfatase [Dinoponera quadriceps]XP_014484331.1 PREDICTED: iduronate 2-sulfatase [Dinoponera quadriceps]XP_014484332.1 PREDICTED: iduronate 2-sulfatase [Dinoponera quadriceps]XP_014484333.1 PREDICTED: iduronate 2-sulfatase [Dinoponera quadriceps]XP_01448433
MTMFTVTCFCLIAITLAHDAAAARPNFLLIIVDDLRTSLGCYGDNNAYTPNIDALAEDSVVFAEAFAQQALCAPSRNSLLTSRRPDTLQLYDFYSYWRDTVGNYTSLPEHLKNNGYTTMSIGKVFHPGISSNKSDDSPYSWTEKPFHPYTDRYKNAPVCKASSQSKAARNIVCPAHVSTMPNKTLPDIETLQEARRFIHKHRRDSKPFFLAVGFQKPHIPLKYPDRFLKYHPIHKFKIPEPYLWPNDVDNVAYNPWTDLRWRQDVAELKLKFPWEKIPEKFGKLIIQSYYAAVSYIDNLIGKLMYQLHVSMVRENTIVILTSDHGWALGEHAVWSKYSNFDVSVHVPLLISIPTLTFDSVNYHVGAVDRTKCTAKVANIASETDDLKYVILNTTKIGDSKTRGNTGYYMDKRKRKVSKVYNRQRYDKFIKSDASYRGMQRKRKVTNAIVELVDIFPTIADLAGAPVPMCQIHIDREHESRLSNLTYRKESDPCSEGITLLPLIRSISRCQDISWKKAAFSQYPRPGIQPTLHPNSDKPHLREITIMGYTLKSNDYRYTAWIPFAHETCKPDWNVLIAEELYDHRVDRAENFNIAATPDLSSTKEYLRSLLRNGWRSALPTY